ncbi:FtsW/RodA/SpoVE family cell cycle protein [Pseudoduganella namucuonensis]|uniref:Probable peptidoglycan glycosyltransferase FtsW n=1 Tax=Pseudoduganella namucuonensis TaxID=1035707 RepID=A0A1I7GRA6_9BURK|nr:FtsW/RodA/SpoVE family cell cycle protein [Pseudoduganella namucuonensis]SFU50975.1 cell division protein FtsW [Pseudoduganella namucuonensis]
MNRLASRLLDGARPARDWPWRRALAKPRLRLASSGKAQAGHARAPTPSPRSRLLLATAALIALLLALQAWSLLRAPAAWYPGRILVRLAPGETLTLGARELAAPRAEQAHLQLRRDARGAWHIASVVSATPPVLHRNGTDLRMSGVTLDGARQFQAGAAIFGITAFDGGEIAFRHAGDTWRYDGATLYRNGAAQPACADAHPAARLAAIWNRAAPRALTLARPLALGGNVHCGNRLGLPALAPGAATLARGDGGLRFAPGAQDDGHTALRIAGATGDTDLRRRELPLAGVSAFTAGNTRFSLSALEGGLALAPARNVALYAAPDARLDPRVEWEWRQRALWGMDAASATMPSFIWLAIAISFAAIAVIAVRRSAARWRDTVTLAAALSLLLAGVLAMLAQRGGHPPSAACSLALAAAALTPWLAVPARLPLAVAAALVLLAAGLLAQLELGLGAGVSSWLRYYQKSTALLAIGSGAGALCRLWLRSPRAPMRQRTVEWLLASLAAVALAALAAQVLWGDETGVFDLQPVELAKLALTALTAHCLALRLGWRSPNDGDRAGGARWLRLIGPALLFLALLGLALVQVDDYSPLILLLIWSAAMACAYALATRKHAMTACLAALALGAGAAVTALGGASADTLAGLSSGFYADRFQVWLAPSEHPHTGQQMLLAARAIAEGGWWGADHMLGLRSLGQPAGAAIGIPAVQDDFAPSFFINRHGLLGALLLWAAQATLLAGLARMAAASRAAAGEARDYRLAWLARFRCFALCGGAAFVFGHLLLSWGTNLAIFPVMGQPMSFLSAGGSHLLFFLCPLLAFSTVSAQS